LTNTSPYSIITLSKERKEKEKMDFRFIVFVVFALVFMLTAISSCLERLDDVAEHFPISKIIAILCWRAVAICICYFIFM
jgi:hypothetical protein